MTAQQIVDLLNEVVVLDKAAIHCLIVNRVPCNDMLAVHPRIQVDGSQASHCSVGLLGLLNGIADLDDELIEAQFTDEQQPQFLGFRLRPKNS